MGHAACSPQSLDLLLPDGLFHLCCRSRRLKLTEAAGCLAWLLCCASLSIQLVFFLCLIMDEGAYTSALAPVSKASLRFSRDVPRVPSFLRAVAVTRDASGPPLGCLVFLSCERQHLPVSWLIQPNTGKPSDMLLYFLPV